MRTFILMFLTTIPLCCAADPVELTGSAAYLKPFLDEEGGFAGGAALRIPLSRRLALRPEILGGTIAGYRRVLLLGNVTFDVTNPDSAAVLYVTGGAGLAYSHHKVISYGYSDGTWLGGVGIRYSVGQSWTSTVEFRVGADAFPVVTVGFGYRFGERR